METVAENPAQKNKALFKALVFVAFIIGAIIAIRFTPLRHYLTAEALGASI